MCCDLDSNSVLLRQGCSTSLIGPSISDIKVRMLTFTTGSLQNVIRGLDAQRHWVQEYPDRLWTWFLKENSWFSIWLWWMAECFSFPPYILNLWFPPNNSTWVSLITSVYLLMFLAFSLSSALGYKLKFRWIDASLLPVASWWALGGTVQQTPPIRRGLNSLQFIGPIWIRAAGRMDVLPEASYCVANRDSHLLTLV
jgi:hypothetical protein